MSETFGQVKDIIVELLGVEEGKVTSEAKFREDLEADSLDLVELIMAFEEKFGGEISDEDAQKITTVGEAVTYLDAHMTYFLDRFQIREAGGGGGEPARRIRWG